MKNLLVLALVVVFVGCSDNKKPAKTNETKTIEKSEGGKTSSEKTLSSKPTQQVAKKKIKPKEIKISEAVNLVLDDRYQIPNRKKMFIEIPSSVVTVEERMKEPEIASKKIAAYQRKMRAPLLEEINQKLIALGINRPAKLQAIIIKYVNGFDLLDKMTNTKDQFVLFQIEILKASDSASEIQGLLNRRLGTRTKSTPLPKETQNIDLKSIGKNLIDQSITQTRQGVVYQVNVQTPFTGYVKNGCHAFTKYKNGKKNGLSKEWDSDGSLQAETNYKNGIKHGTARKWSWGRLINDFNYIDGQKNGVEMQWYSNSKKIKSEISYKNGKKDGLSKEWDSAGKLLSAVSYKNGEKDGSSKTWFVNGQLKSERNYKDGKKNGSFKWWDKNGQVTSESNYKDDKKDGAFKEFKDGKSKSIANYKNDVEDGESKEWWDNGKLKSETHYKDGKVVGIAKTWSRFKDGELETEIDYRNGWDNRIEKKYSWGKVISEIRYKKNVKDGICSEFYEKTGEIYRQTPFQKGDKHGAIKTFNKNGTVKTELYYFKGLPCSKSRYEIFLKNEAKHKK